MSDWQRTYGGKLVPPDDAISHIRTTDRVCMSFGLEPLTLVTALCGRAEELRGIEVLCPGNTDVAAWFDPDFGSPFRIGVETVAGSPLGMPAIANRTADFYPNLFSQTFKAFDERENDAQRIDVALVTVTPPDEGGYCSFGPIVWYQPSLARRAALTIAEVDPDMPRMHGSRIHVSDLDLLVERQVSRTPRFRPEPEPHTHPIAGYVKEFVRDGDTLQIGTGTVTAALIRLGLLDGRQDIGWHSEATAPGIVSLVMRGVITGRRKSVDRGILVTTSLAMTDEERAFAEGNLTVEVRDVTSVNDIRVIASQENMVAINNAMSVDLTGQTASEGIGPRLWRGMGGQPEFAIGAFMAKGGRSIIVLPSVTSDGVSRICGQLLPGSYVTVPRYFADIIVTEWGVARLLGKSQRQRAESLIAIAHPDHRADLRRMAQKQFYP